MNIIEAATALKEGKRAFHPRLGWEVYVDYSRHRMVSNRYDGEPIRITLDDVLSEKWTVANG